MLLLAFALRALLAVAGYFALGITAFHSLDTGSYIDSALSIAREQRFAINNVPEIVRTPGYPLFLAPGAWLGSIEFWGVALQILLSVLTVYLVYRVALLLFSRNDIAVLCALLYAVEPLSILFASKILTETLFTALVLFSLYCILRYVRHSSPTYLAVGALSLSASIFVRPINLYFPLVMAAILLAWAVWGPRHSRDVATRFAAPVLFLVLSIGPLLIWQARNAAAADYHGFSAISDINWYFYQGASVTAALRGVPYYTIQDELGYSDRAIYYKNHPEQRAWPLGQVYEYMGSEGRRVVFQHPASYAVIHAKGMLKTLTNPGGVEYLKMLGLYPEEGGDFGVAVNAGLRETLTYLLTQNPLLLAVNVIFGLMLLFYLIFALIGFFSRQTFTFPMLTVLATGLYLLVLSGGPQSLSRFRHPIMPILCILAGHGFFLALERFHARKPTHWRAADVSEPDAV